MGSKPQGSQNTFDGFIAKYAVAPEDLKQAALIAACRVLDGEDLAYDEPLLSLKQVTKAVGYGHYSTLHRLQIQRVAEDFGGRLKYRRSRVEAFLRSPEVASLRVELAAMTTHPKPRQANQRRSNAGFDVRKGVSFATGDTKTHPSRDACTSKPRSHKCFPEDYLIAVRDEHE